MDALTHFIKLVKAVEVEKKKWDDQPVKKIENKIKEIFPGAYSDPTANYYDIYVDFEISGIKFVCVFSFLFDKNEYLSGVYSFNENSEINREGAEKVLKFLQPLFDRQIINPENLPGVINGGIMYGSKRYTSDKSADVLTHFIDLVNTVKAEKGKIG
jgi:hypothetical protein